MCRLERAFAPSLSPRGLSRPKRPLGVSARGPEQVTAFARASDCATTAVVWNMLPYFLMGGIASRTSACGLLRGEGEEDVAGHAVAGADVAGADEEHARCDDRAGAPSDPPLAATRLTDVNSRAVSNRQISWPSAVERACKTPSHPPAKTTPGITVTAASNPFRGRPPAPGCAGDGRDRNVPQNFSVREAHRRHGAGLRIVVNVVLVRSAAPHNLHLDRRGRVAASGKIGGPEKGTAPIGIERDNFAALMRADEDALAVRERLQNRRVSKVPIGANFRGAVSVLGAGADAIAGRCVVGERLIRPEHFARLQIKAMIESDVFAAGSVKPLPVPT